MQSKVFHCAKEADAVAVIAENLSSFLCLICQPRCKLELSLLLFQKAQLVKVRFCILWQVISRLSISLAWSKSRPADALQCTRLSKLKCSSKMWLYKTISTTTLQSAQFTHDSQSRWLFHSDSTKDVTFFLRISSLMKSTFSCWSWHLQVRQELAFWTSPSLDWLMTRPWRLSRSSAKCTIARSLSLQSQSSSSSSCSQMRFSTLETNSNSSQLRMTPTRALCSQWDSNLSLVSKEMQIKLLTSVLLTASQSTCCKLRTAQDLWCPMQLISNPSRETS